MLKMRKGFKVPFPEMLSEGYQRLNNQLIANVNADKIEEMLTHFIDDHNEPLFFILELPSHQDDEIEISPNKVESFHKDVYFIDGCSQDKAKLIMKNFGTLMINDGMCSFGFGGHTTHDEIMIEKYNLLMIYTSNTHQFTEFFKQHDIKEVENLKTAWNTFSKDHPGESSRIITDEIDVFKLPELLYDWGIYYYEKRVD